LVKSSKMYNFFRTVSLVGSPNLVLTVATPPLKDDGSLEERVATGLYEQVRLIVTNRKAVVNGNANQIFWLDEETKLFHAFATDDVNMGMLKRRILFCIF